GTIVQVELSMSLVKYKGRPASMAIIHDIAKRKLDEEALRESREQLERLHRMSRVLSASLDLDKVLGPALNEVARMCGGAESDIGIAILDEWGQHMTIAAAVGPLHARLQGIELPVARLLPEAVQVLFQERRPWLQHDVSRSSQILREVPGFLEYDSFVAVPLVSGDRTTGVLFLGLKDQGIPAAKDVALLEICAQDMALAVNNARLYAQTDAALRRRVAEMEALTSVLSAATHSLDLDAVLQDVLKRAADALGMEGAAVFLTSDDLSSATARAVYQRNSSPVIGGSPVTIDLNKFDDASRKSIRAGEAVVIDNSAAIRSVESRLKIAPHARSVLLVPIIMGGSVMGVISFASAVGSRSLSREEISWAQAVAGHLASIIDNARLHERTARERSTLESIVASMGEGLLVLDAQRHVIHCNRAAEDLLDIDARPLIGQPVEVFQAAWVGRVEDRDKLRSEWSIAVDHLTTTPAPVGFRLSVGSTARDVQAFLFQVAHGVELLGIGALFRDVTREREIDRMKTEFISIASHELRTPMTAIFGFSELLLTRAGNLNDKQQKWVQTIYKESKRLSDIVEDLLNVSRIEAGRLSLNVISVDLKPMVGDIIGQFREAHPKHVLSDNLEAGLPEVHVDVDKLHRVLYNLVDNAIKYTPGGGPVVVSAVQRPDENRVVIGISDHGLGISESEMPRLFTRFHRIDRPENVGLRGTGLGLYIARSLVDMMGGAIWAESKVNEGSTFYVSLPAVADSED
ncbi:MAG: ATP-binding protein, partial [Dehalococcoidia bacterium]|nr:ATP-binding protein [Dehalococcoidia bacterium]